jgi:hypothetical protein
MPGTEKEKMETTDRGVIHVPTGEGKSLRLMGNRLEIKAASEHTGEAFAILEYRMAAHTPGRRRTCTGAPTRRSTCWRAS